MQITSSTVTVKGLFLNKREVIALQVLINEFDGLLGREKITRISQEYQSLQNDIIELVREIRALKCQLL